MRAGRPSLALSILAFWPFACAVYNDDSLGLGLGGGAAVDNSAGSSAAGTNAKGGASNVGSAGASPIAQGGAANLGGAAAETLAGSGGAGDLPSGGDSSSEGGESPGGSTSGGSGGASAGAGGKGGAAGNGGAPTTAGVSGSAGNSGSGGGPVVPHCSEHPLTARSSWVASASHPAAGSADQPSNLLDGKITRWTTGKAQSGDEWLQIDFGATVTVNHINLQQGDDTNDYPRTYSVIVSNTPKDSSGMVRGTGSGKSGVSTPVLLPALASGRYLLIKQSSTSLSWWSAEEIEVSCAD